MRSFSEAAHGFVLQRHCFLRHVVIQNFLTLNDVNCSTFNWMIKYGLVQASFGRTTGSSVNGHLLVDFPFVLPILICVILSREGLADLKTFDEGLMDGQFGITLPSSNFGK